MKKIFLICFIILFLNNLIFADNLGEPPGLPDNIYGEIYINGEFAEIDTTIYAKVGTNNSTEYIITESGKFGSIDDPSKKFLVFRTILDVGEEINFYVFDKSQNEVFAQTIPETIYYDGGENKSIVLNFTIEDITDDTNITGDDDTNTTEDTNTTIDDDTNITDDDDTNTTEDTNTTIDDDTNIIGDDDTNITDDDDTNTTEDTNTTIDDDTNIIGDDDTNITDDDDTNTTEDTNTTIDDDTNIIGDDDTNITDEDDNDSEVITPPSIGGNTGGSSGGGGFTNIITPENNTDNNYIDQNQIIEESNNNETIDKNIATNEDLEKKDTNISKNYLNETKYTVLSDPIKKTHNSIKNNFNSQSILNKSLVIIILLLFLLGITFLIKKNKKQ